MTSVLSAITFAAADPDRLARFWSDLLDWSPVGGRGNQSCGVTIQAVEGTGVRLRFRPELAPKTRPNLGHLDLASASLADQQARVARALQLGASHLDVGQLPEEEHVVLADPEGNEFCVVEPGNNFLAGCGLVGALACEGSHRVGCFWSAALGWPLVWDFEEETAIQAPTGGTKISWGGPPEQPRTGPERVRFDLACIGDPAMEVERLVGSGATRLGRIGDDVLLADPDGSEFRLLAPAR